MHTLIHMNVSKSGSHKMSMCEQMKTKKTKHNNF